MCRRITGTLLRFPAKIGRWSTRAHYLGLRKSRTRSRPCLIFLRSLHVSPLRSFQPIHLRPCNFNSKVVYWPPWIFLLKVFGATDHWIYVQVPGTVVRMYNNQSHSITKKAIFFVWQWILISRFSHSLSLSCWHFTEPPSLSSVSSNSSTFTPAYHHLH